MPSLQGLIEGLQELGTADRIADMFRENDIKGLRFQPCGCPVSRYLQANTGNPDINVSPNAATAYDAVFTGCHTDRAEWSADSPVYDFITRFDSGDYPELEAR